MYTIILLTPDNSGRVVSNIGRDLVHCFIGVGENEMYFPLGSFAPDTIGGNPYRYMDYINLLAEPNFNPTLDNSKIVVYSLSSGSDDTHNGLHIGQLLNTLKA